MEQKTKSLVILAAGALIYAVESPRAQRARLGLSPLVLDPEAVAGRSAAWKALGGIAAYEGLKGLGCSTQSSLGLVIMSAFLYGYLTTKEVVVMHG